jgi:hypothetical protein
MVPFPTLSVADTGTHLSSLPADQNEHGAVPGAITARIFRIRYNLLPPLPRKRAYLNPPLLRTRPPKTLANRCQAARARSRSAAIVNQEHHRVLVNHDTLLIPLLHLLSFLSLAHLSDTLLRLFVHQDIETAHDQIPLSARRNSGERLPKLQDTSTVQTSPPDPPH